MKKLLKKLHKERDRYFGALLFVENELADKIEFEFKILWQPSDGFVMLNIEHGDNALLVPLLEIIDKKGKLTLDDYNEERI